ncbi:unannotated protein [freshwater metagenome]|uniref:Unannotated protein n=1 Tax=freshwater metagenome TaxID=449393 RepID=A0A6J7E653_9ZZZZ|nr:hypothetical protein [Actinomycetota bacterium]
MSPFWFEDRRDVVRVSGADALTYLQSQISQDIRGLADGGSAYSFVLQPMGKIDALVRIVRHSAEEFVLDTDPGFGEIVVTRLNRFKIRVKVDIAALAWRCIAVRGADAPIDAAVPAWGRPDAFDILGENPRPPVAVRVGSAEELLAARIEAGWPAMGSEITDASIPAETGVVAEAVNFTKGCYPGQELVERMDSRGSQAPRFVRRLRGTGDAVVGDEVMRDAGVVGHLTSVVGHDGVWAALATVARSVQLGDTVTVRGAVSTLEPARDLPPA